jgi:hypothetical protein
MMNESEAFLAGAVASSFGDLKVSKLATGALPPVLFRWFHIHDPNKDECVVVLMEDAEDGGHPTIGAKEDCVFGDKKSATRALIRTLNLGGSKEQDNSETFFCALADGWVNSQLLDAEMMRIELERGAAALKDDFNFAKWASEHGFDRS